MLKRNAATLAGIMFCSVAQATLIPYEVVLTVDRVVALHPCDTLVGHTTFGCVADGQRFVGRFSVDDSLLGRSGVNLNAPIFNFRLQIGDVVWDQDHRSDLSSFRRFSEDPSGPSGFGPAPSFNVSDGELTAMTGGVVGHGDAPFVDFYNVPLLGRFNAQDDSITWLQGAMAVSRLAAAVPEPIGLAWFALLAGGLVFGRRKW